MKKTTKTKINHFSWRAIDLQGNEISGKSNANSKQAVREYLQNQALSPLKIQTKIELSQQHAKKITDQEIQHFIRQLARLLTAGINLEQALALIYKGTTHALYAELVNTIKQNVVAGTSLADSLKKHPRYFSHITCALIHTGEQTGKLTSCLEKIKQFQQTNAALKQQIKKALFYPSCVFAIAFLVSTGLLLFVVPQFQSIFSSFNAKLPWLTQQVISLSHLLQHRALLLITSLSCLVLAFAFIKKRQASTWQRIINFLKLNIPLIKSFYLNHLTTTWCHIMAISLDVGIPLTKAMQMAGLAIQNQKIKSRLNLAQNKVSTGRALSQSLQQTQLFKDEEIQMLQVGEEASQLTEMLSHIAIAKENNLNNQFEKMTKLFEPILMLFIASIVGGFIIAMYLPIFKLGSIM